MLRLSGITQWLWQRFLKVVMVLSLCCKYLPLRNVWINCKFLHVGMLTLCVKFSYKWSMWSWWKEKFELIPFPNGRFVPGLDENGWEVLEKAFKSSRTVFIFSLSISSLKRTWFFIRGNLNVLHTMVLCAKFGWNWFNVSAEEFQTEKNTTYWEWLAPQGLSPFWVRTVHVWYHI